MTPGAFQTTFAGADNGAPYGWQNSFVAKLDPDGRVVWASYLGVDMNCRSLTLDADGDIYAPMNYFATVPQPAWFSLGAFANA